MSTSYSWIKSCLLIHEAPCQWGAAKHHLDTQSQGPFPSGTGHTQAGTAQLLPNTPRSRKTRLPMPPPLHLCHLFLSYPPGPFGPSLLTHPRDSWQTFLKMWQVCTAPTRISSRPKHPWGHMKVEERKAVEKKSFRLRSRKLVHTTVTCSNLDFPCPQTLKGYQFVSANYRKEKPPHNL